MPKKLSFGFISDPLDNYNREAETSLFLMREVFKRGYSIFVCEPEDLFLKQNEVLGHVKKIELTGFKHCFYRILDQKPIALSSLDCLFLRKDPPFDLAYLHHLYLLMKLEKKVLMINEPSAILKFNEKLAALDFPYVPKTLVSGNIKQILEWGSKFPLGVILKPLNYGGGSGIFWIKKSEVRSQRSERIVKRVTENGTQPIICQEYLKAAKTGDKRIMLWDGKVLGAFLRKPKPGEFRANLHQGGRFIKCALNAHDKRIIRKVAPWTKSRGLYFVGLDVIGSKLTEINVTSPMGIREVNVLYRKQVEKEILDSILRKI